MKKPKLTLASIQLRYMNYYITTTVKFNCKNLGFDPYSQLALAFLEGALNFTFCFLALQVLTLVIILLTLTKTD